jgi:general secretion pathway protein K
MKIKSQQGVAIITALLIVALAATTATYLLWQQSLWTRQVENLIGRAKANAIAQAGAQLARGQLNEFADTKIIYQFLGKELPLPAPAEGASMVGMMVDEQSKLNLNSQSEESRR